MKYIGILLILLMFFGCDSSKTKPHNPKQNSLYTSGDIVCLKLTHRKVLVSNIAYVNGRNTSYDVVVDYTNEDSRYPLVKRLYEFELCSCDSL